MREPTYDDALLLAVRAHAGQTRDCPGGGTEPYVCHPIRVAAAFTDDLDRQVALLHDVLEDTDTQIKQLFEWGYDLGVIVSVLLLTRDSNHSYARHVVSILASQDQRAVRVKLADLADNLATLDRQHEHLRPRYEAAIKTLSTR